MTDKEAYELLVKYSGEKGLVMQREMLRNVGIDKTMKSILQNYKVKVPDEFKIWMKQGLTYLNKKMSEPLN